MIVSPVDQKAAVLVAASYAPPPGYFDHVDLGADDGVRWMIKHEPEGDYIVLPGSENLPDWIRDLDTVPWPTRRFGIVHRGFFMGMDHVWEDAQVEMRAGVDVFLVGHSLGAARSSILAGIMVAAGVAPARRVGFGEPRPGFQRLADFIKAVPQASYCNGDDDNHDGVTEVPFTIPEIGLDFIHTISPTSLRVSPLAGDARSFFRYHHMPLYAQAMLALNTGA